MDDRFWWHLARSSGLVSWALLTLSTCCGLLLAARVVGGASVRAVVAAHRVLAAVGLGLVAVHLVALVADDYVSFGLLDLIVPFHADWRPGAVAWGVMATWLLIGVEVATLAHARLSRRAWHMVHRLSLPAWGAATVHLLKAGSDVGGRFVGMLAMAAVAMTVFLAVARFGGLFRRSSTQVGPGLPDQQSVNVEPGSEAESLIRFGGPTSSAGRPSVGGC